MPTEWSRVQKLAVLVVVALTSLCGAAVPAQTASPYVVAGAAAPCVKVRAAPHGTAAVLDCLPPGVPVTVIASVPYWRQVRLADGREGWAAKKFLDPSPAPTPGVLSGTLPADAWLEVHVVDVGQGDGIWIHTHDDGIAGNGLFEGRNVVIDGGPESADAKNALLAYLEARAHHDAIIDTLILTHPHVDHFRGAETIFRHFEVARYYDPGFPSTLASYASFLAAARTETVQGHPARIMVGRTNFEPLDWGNEVKAEVLYAYPGTANGLGSGNTLVNNASIVLRIEYGEHVLLFMGDAEGKNRTDDATQPAKYVERVLLDTVPHDRLKATVLKIAHHG